MDNAVNGHLYIAALGLRRDQDGKLSADQAAAQRVLKAAKEIYQTGMYWDRILQPRLTATNTGGVGVHAVGGDLSGGARLIREVVVGVDLLPELSAGVRHPQ